MDNQWFHQATKSSMVNNRHLYSIQVLKQISISGGSRISRRGDVDPLGGRGPPTQALFGENVCENE